MCTYHVCFYEEMSNLISSEKVFSISSAAVVTDSSRIKILILDSPYLFPYTCTLPLGHSKQGMHICSC